MGICRVDSDCGRVSARGLSLVVMLSPIMAQGGLLDVSFQTELEQRSAVANQASYDQLKQSTSCNDVQTGTTVGCTGGTFSVWKNVRELVHTANELTGDGPTRFSLGQDAVGLGFSMRWTAGEEFASQGSMSSSFINGQLSGLAARVTALRHGARGFQLTGVPASDKGQHVAWNDRWPARGGGASADAGGVQWSRWGGFVNMNYVAGSRDPTEREDAFDFDGGEVTGGFDFRVTDAWVVGLLLGYQQQLVDFDSSQSIVDGEVRGTGFSLIPFALWQSERWFWSGSVGYQRMRFDTERRISYPSLNPDIASTNTVSKSDATSNNWSLTTSGGYTFRPTRAMTLEPYVSADYYRIVIGEYSETDIRDDAFNFIVDKQDFDYLEGIVGLNLRYVVTSRFGVLIPLIGAQWHHQFKAESRDITAVYQSASSTLASDPRAFFRLPTDALDEDYQVYTVGLSAVVRGARQRALGAAAAGGVQAYLIYRQVSNLELFEQQGISLGFRYEF